MVLYLVITIGEFFVVEGNVVFEVVVVDDNGSKFPVEAIKDPMVIKGSPIAHCYFCNNKVSSGSTFN